MKGRIEKTTDSLVLYLWEDKPWGEKGVKKKIAIPNDASKISVSNMPFRILKTSETDLLGISAICVELDVNRPHGYEGEIDEIYLIRVPEIEEVIGVRHRILHVECNGDEHLYNGPFKLSEKQKDYLNAEGIDLKVLQK